MFNYEALQLLSTAIVSPKAFSAAFHRVLAAGDAWLLPQNLDVINLLLEHGASGEVVHNALFQALDAYTKGTVSEVLLDLLLCYKADVNFLSGGVVWNAASSGNPALLKKVLNHGASPESVSMALSAAVASNLEEAHLCSLMDVFMENRVKPDPNFVYPSMEGPLILSLQWYPQSVAVAQRICALGCNLEAPVSWQVYADALQEAEVGTALIWALFQSDRMISTAVIQVLLEAKANPNCTTSISKTTPLHIAAEYGRSDVVTLLLKHGAKVSSRDAFDRAALFYASGNGNTDSIAAILKAKTGPNDGSLHEAARELHAPAVKLLVKGGHHPDFTSTKHDGRTALAELALYCASSPTDDRIDDTIDALIAGRVDPLKKCYGKNPLYLALENRVPFAIVNKLVERIYWQYLNHPANLYVEDDIYYSPTMYVIKGFLPLPRHEMTDLVQLLRYHGAIHIYYAAEGHDQPPDAINMPKEVVEAQRKKKLREEKIRQQDEDHQRALMREAEAAGLKAQIKSTEHEAKLQHMSREQAMKFSQSAAANRQRLEVQAAQKQIDTQAARNKLAVQSEATRMKLIEGNAKVNLNREIQRTTAQSKLVQHRIQMEQMQAKEQIAQMKRLER
jgi:hypothetical protein